MVPPQLPHALSGRARTLVGDECLEASQASYFGSPCWRVCVCVCGGEVGVGGFASNENVTDPTTTSSLYPSAAIRRGGYRAFVISTRDNHVCEDTTSSRWPESDLR
jgi:hypothetical protein